MSNMFIGRFVASILALLIASSVLHTHGQSQNAVLSDEDQAEILESLIQLEIKTFPSEFGNIRAFSRANIGPVLATRITKQGFSLMEVGDILRWKNDHVIEYLVIRSIHLREGIMAKAGGGSGKALPTMDTR